MTAGAAGRGGASGLRRWLRGRAVRLALVLGLALAYGLAFPWLRSHLGAGAGLLAIVLIILGGLLFGKRGGLLVGVAVPIYNTLLLNLAGEIGWDAALRETSGLGALAAVAIGLIIGHMRDLAQALERQVAEQQRSRAALHESQQLFESSFRHAAIGMALVAPDGRWLQVNAALCALVGYSEHELLRTTFQAITHPDDLETDLDYVRQMLAGAIPTYQMEKRYFHKTGHVIWVLLNVSLVRDSQGQPQYFLSQIQDITERKQVELALRESEARYRDLFEASSVSLWEQDFSGVRRRLAELRQQGISDFRGYFQRHPEAAAACAALVRITDVNPATLRLYGANSKADLLQGLDRVFMEESLAGFADELAAIADGKTEFDGESTNRTLAGERLVVNVRWSVARGHEASFDKVIVSLTDITERKRAEEQLQHAAFHDALTGLPNRALFLDRLRQAIQRHRRRPEFMFAVLFLDFDRFKVVNDSLGHQVGDQLLIAGAQRLTTCVRSLDTVARLGGDEFIILLEDVRGLEAVTEVADRIQHALQQPFDLRGHKLATSASIGIVLSAGASDQPEDMLRDADAAMYRAKALGKARHEVFQTEMRTEAVARLKLETDLRRALEQHEFRVHYQPIVSLETGEPAGFEALVRWEHPELGLLLPAAFLATAEETGLIVPIGQWVLVETCRQLGAWQAQFPRRPPLTVSVNMSSHQIGQPELDQFISALLREHRIAPGSLRLEITERTIIDETPATAGTLARLKGLGVRLEIDDFGTGYSALGYLQRLELDALKIDRSFIRQLGNDGSRGALVRTILALGQSLDMQIIAEGVESEDQLTKLKDMGCQTGQGYLFGRPMDAGAVERLLEG